MTVTPSAGLEEVGDGGVLGVPADHVVAGGRDAPRRRRVPCTSSARRASRACSDAVSSTRTSASGATTVVMSRPSTTMPPSSAAISRAAGGPARRARPRLVATALTAAEIRGSRIGAPSRPGRRR